MARATRDSRGSATEDEEVRWSLDMLEPLEGNARLGRGSFGEVQKVRRKGTSKIYALKTIKKSDVLEGNLIDQVEREIEVQKSLKHRNVLRLYQHFEDQDSVFLLLEYCAKGELYQIMRTRKGRRFPEPLACKYFCQVVDGLRYLHSKKIIHRDIKPENLLVNDKDQVKIADFGWCAVLQGERTTFCGTLDYLAPEMIRGSGHDHTLDLWGLGVLLYEMVAGKPPFQSTNHGQLISKILHLDLRPNPQMSEQLVGLVRAMLRKEPAERLPLDRVMLHPWVLQNLHAEQPAEQPRAGSFGNPSSEEGSRTSGATVAFSAGLTGPPTVQPSASPRPLPRPAPREVAHLAHLATPRLLTREVEMHAEHPSFRVAASGQSPHVQLRSPVLQPRATEDRRARYDGYATPPVPEHRPPLARSDALHSQLSPAKGFRELTAEEREPPLSQCSSMTQVSHLGQVRPLPLRTRRPSPLRSAGKQTPQPPAGPERIESSLLRSPAAGFRVGQASRRGPVGVGSPAMVTVAPPGTLGRDRAPATPAAQHRFVRNDAPAAPAPVRDRVASPGPAPRRGLRAKSSGPPGLEGQVATPMAAMPDSYRHAGPHGGASPAVPQPSPGPNAYSRIFRPAPRGPAAPLPGPASLGVVPRTPGMTHRATAPLHAPNVFAGVSAYGVVRSLR